MYVFDEELVRQYEPDEDYYYYEPDLIPFGAEYYVDERREFLPDVGSLLPGPHPRPPRPYPHPRPPYPRPPLPSSSLSTAGRFANRNRMLDEQVGVAVAVIAGAVSAVVSAGNAIKGFFSGGKQKEEQLKQDKLNAVKGFLDQNGAAINEALNKVNDPGMLKGRDLNQYWSQVMLQGKNLWSWMYPNENWQQYASKNKAKDEYDQAIADMAYRWGGVKYALNTMQDKYNAGAYHDAYWFMALLLGNKDLDPEAYNRNAAAGQLYYWNCWNEFQETFNKLVSLYQPILEAQRAQETAAAEAVKKEQDKKRMNQTMMGIGILGIVTVGGLLVLKRMRKRKKPELKI